MSTTTTNTKSARLHFLCFSHNSNVLKRCSAICQEFEYSFLAQAATDALMDDDKPYEQVHFALIDASEVEKKEDIIGNVQVARQFLKDTFIFVLVGKRIPSDAADFIKKSGANLVMMESAFFDTSRLEYVASQVIRASYVPVKVSEFKKDVTLDFTLFHLMPLNQKMIPVLPKGTQLTEGRFKKFEGVGEVYVRREETDLYKIYIEKNQDLSAQGLLSRCRAQYLSFCHSHAQLIFMLIDQADAASYKEGKWLYERCEVLAKDLLITLSSVGEAWDIVNNSSLGEFGSVERSPTVAAYSGLFSLMSSIDEPVDVMIAGLLSDVGMLELSPLITKKMRQGQSVGTLNADELADYHKHPVLSVNRCLEKKLTLKDSLKELILCTHEKANAKGFPQQRIKDKIPMGAMLLQFAEMLDRATMLKMGQARAPLADIRKKLVEQETMNADVFSVEFITKLVI